MRKIKKEGKPTQPDHIDNKTGSEIPEQFAKVYESLFNSIDDEIALQDLLSKLQNRNLKASEVENITPEIVKQAVKKLQPGKTDISGQFKSDVFLHAPEILFSNLAKLFQSYFIHEDFTIDILCCAFMPLLKGALKDDTNSNNY